MKKFSRAIHWMLGIGFIFIGSLHLQAHYSKLLNVETANLMAQEVPGMPEMGVTYYQLYIGFSFMMGVSFVIIGLLNLVLMKSLAKDAFPAMATTISMIILMSCVAYSGLHFFGAMQLYSGSLMSVLLTISLVLKLTNKS